MRARRSRPTLAWAHLLFSKGVLPAHLVEDESRDRLAALRIPLAELPSLEELDHFNPRVPFPLSVKPGPPDTALFTDPADNGTSPPS
jgi:hypothetical protein